MEELQAQLENKENALQRMEQTLVDAKKALESAETVQSLHEKIQKMEVDERKLKEEVQSCIRTGFLYAINRVFCSYATPKSPSRTLLSRKKSCIKFCKN